MENVEGGVCSTSRKRCIIFENRIRNLSGRWGPSEIEESSADNRGISFEITPRKIPTGVIDPKTAGPLFGAIKCDVYHVNFRKVPFMFRIGAKTPIILRAVSCDQQPRDHDEIGVEDVRTTTNMSSVCFKHGIEDCDI
jgi:hypothetical protein